MLTFFDFGGGGPASDPHWSNVVLLWEADPTAGSSGTLRGTDVSPIGRTITYTTGDAPYARDSFVKFGPTAMRCLDTDATPTTGIIRARCDDSDDFHFADQPFTIEVWASFSLTSGTHYLFGHWDLNSQRSWALRYRAGALEFAISSNGTTDTVKLTETWSPTLDQYHHLAVDFDGTTYRLYIEGTMVDTAGTAVSLHNSTGTFRLCSSVNNTTVGNYFYGWMEELRITKGVARYANNSGFSVPTARFPRTA